MAEHTPGPWVLHESETRFVRESNLTLIADCMSGNRHTDEERANAHLIAAAPELLAALELVLKANDDFEEAYMFGISGEEKLKMMERAREACIKAEEQAHTAIKKAKGDV